VTAYSIKEKFPVSDDSGREQETVKETVHTLFYEIPNVRKECVAAM
jgi:hypothetical protein